MPDEVTQQPFRRGEVLARISTGLVQLHSRHYGKGPTKAKTYIMDDTVVCVLRDGLTTAERTLLETGEDESVHRMRRSFQKAMESKFRRIVENETGRKTIAYMSGVHTDPDLDVEVFLLEPLPGGDGPSDILESSPVQEGPAGPPAGDS